MKCEDSTESVESSEEFWVIEEDELYSTGASVWSFNGVFHMCFMWGCEREIEEVSERICEAVKSVKNRV